MNLFFNKSLFFLFMLLNGFNGHAVKNPVTSYKADLRNHWQIQSSLKVKGSGKEISTVGFNTMDWHAAQMPGTVLGSLVKDSVYKNIFYGRNLSKIHDSSFQFPWWYRTTFNLKDIKGGQVIRLQLNGINYRADVWLNGRKIASSDTIEGSFCRFHFNISRFIKTGENVLALKIIPPDTGDLTMGFVDWNPEPPDHNMGIWRTAYLKITGPVSIDRPYVVTKLDTATLEKADLTISAVVKNYSDKNQQGTLKGRIGDQIAFSKMVTLKPHEVRKIIFNPTHFPQLSLQHPRIWWIHTWGKPNLYNLHLAFVQKDDISDTQHIRFGIRSVSSYVTPEGYRGFKLNGKKILIKGGGWTDPMLLNASPAYEEAGIDYAVHMNLNAIRMEGFWGHDQHIYDLCDEKGILIMAGLSCQWEWSHLLHTKEQDQYSSIITPEQNSVAARSWHDEVLWLRNHPSIFLWLYGSDKWPRPSLEKKYLEVLQKYDTTRPYESSAAEHTSILTGPSRVKMRGPYDYVPPDYWYVDTLHGGAFGFNTETSPGPEIPVLESLKKMIPPDSLWPVGSAWYYHSARGNFKSMKNYERALTERLGKPKNIKDYERKAQYLNYEGMRAMFEAFETNRFKATGIIQWMFNAAWPKLWWQLYDYYLMPTAAFYGAQKANEPVHISYDYKNNAVDVMNNTLREKEHLNAEIKVYDFNLKSVLQKKISINYLNPRKTLQLMSLPPDTGLSKTWFLSLTLRNQKGQAISRNFYALSTQKDKLNENKITFFVTPETQYADLTSLAGLPYVKLKETTKINKEKDTTFFQVKVKNPTSHLAFMIHFDLKSQKSNESVVPVFWKTNYITLLPGEDRTVTGYCHSADLQGQKVKITIDGWNIL